MQWLTVWSRTGFSRVLVPAYSSLSACRPRMWPWVVLQLGLNLATGHAGPGASWEAPRHKPSSAAACALLVAT